MRDKVRPLYYVIDEIIFPCTLPNLGSIYTDPDLIMFLMDKYNHNKIFHGYYINPIGDDKQGQIVTDYEHKRLHGGNTFFEGRCWFIDNKFILKIEGLQILKSTIAHTREEINAVLGTPIPELIPEPLSITEKYTNFSNIVRQKLNPTVEIIRPLTSATNTLNISQNIPVLNEIPNLSEEYMQFLNDQLTNPTPNDDEEEHPFLSHRLSSI